MRLEGLYQEAIRLSREHQIPLSDFIYLLSQVTDLTASQIVLEKHRELENSELNIWRQFIERRLAGEPSQYITGIAWFWGRPFVVNPNCLIPRPETEGLVELIVKNVRSCSPRVLDIGTGSGAIAISLFFELDNPKVHAVDISEQALELAKENADRLGAEIQFHLGDLFPPEDLSFDLIVSNPPYISISEYQALESHIRLHEPRLALLAENDGLIFYEWILQKAREYLSPDGLIAFEIGANQANSIKSIAKNLRFCSVEIYQDLNDMDRYLLIRP